MVNHLGFQILLEAVRGFLLFQSSKLKNETLDPYVCDHKFEGELGHSPLTVIPATNQTTGLNVERNSFWFRGVDDDFNTMQQLKQAACEDATIPVIVFAMQPMNGFVLEIDTIHYMPDKRIRTWEEYDEKVDYYAEHLAEIPSIIVMEPSLLMHTFRFHSGYQNTEYQLAFASRVEKVIKQFPNSWVYVDAGNAMYLQWTVNLEHIISVLKKMPAFLRGFSVNVGSFVNNTFNRQLADEIYCQTGLHYIIDTSRSGGEFSKRSIQEINECIYDPPMVERGDAPSWQSGSDVKQLSAQTIASGTSLVDSSNLAAEEEDSNPPFDYSMGGRFGNEGKRRRKRWIFPEQEEGAPIFESNNPTAGGTLQGDGGSNRGEGAASGAGGNVGGTDAIGEDYYDYYDTAVKACVSPGQQEGLDAFAWVKTPGESDGRMFPSGTFHSCLLGHIVECNDQCPQYVPKLRGEFQRSDACTCFEQ